MSEEKGNSLSIERILLIVVSVLLLITLAYLGVSALARRWQEAPPPVAAPVESAEEQPAGALPTEPMVVEPVVEPPVAEPTSSVQRLEVPPTPTPLVISDEDDPRAILDLAHPDHTDYFINPDTWYDYEAAGGAYSVQDGKLVGTDYVAQKGLYWSYTSVQSGRVYAEISATNGDCISKDSVGLVIRIDPEQTPSGYALEVSCDGAWRLIRFRPAGGATATQVDWTASEVIRTGKDETNRLGLWGYDGKFYIFINGFQVGEHWDAGMPWAFGYFAAYVRAEYTYPLSATFDDFAFWHIPFIP
jgi:hypothetical protein